MPAIRVGLNSGTVTVGMTGSEGSCNTRTLGDEVNLASRLEGANKFFGSKIMASEASMRGAKDASTPGSLAACASWARRPRSASSS